MSLQLPTTLTCTRQEETRTEMSSHGSLKRSRGSITNDSSCLAYSLHGTLQKKAISSERHTS